MNMQQMIIAMQKMQREASKKQAELESKEFTYTANSAVKVTLFGSKKVKSIEFLDKDILDKDNDEMLSDMITLAINNCIDEIAQAETQIEAELKSKSGGMFF